MTTGDKPTVGGDDDDNDDDDDDYDDDDQGRPVRALCDA